MKKYINIYYDNRAREIVVGILSDSREEAERNKALSPEYTFLTCVELENEILS